MLSHTEQERYARQIILEGWGLDGQERLKEKTAFVAGAGGSGSVILTQLALLGIGKIKLCDFDTVAVSNLNRQFIHCTSDESRVGMPKVFSAKKTIGFINPYVEVEIFHKKITVDNIDEMVGDADIIFDSVDSFPVKFILSESAIRKSIPHLFYGMADINSFVGLFYPPYSPCFHCLFDAAKVGKLSYIERFFKKTATMSPPTPVCCSTLFSSAGFAMTEALKLMLNLGEPMYKKFFLFLQKGTENQFQAKGWQGVMFWASDHFKSQAIQQGIDLLNGRFARKFMFELAVERNNICPQCRQFYVK